MTRPLFPRLHRALVLLIGVAATTAAACNLSTDPVEPDRFGSGPRRILFIGNSLTAWNVMPGMVAALAESAKVAPLPSIEIFWQPDFALVDHWSRGVAQKLIADGHFDVVVLQQGPSSVAVNRDTLRLAAKLFAPLIRDAGGIPALFAVWPMANRQVDFDRATESYRLAAQDVSGMLFPGGETWRAAWRRNPDFTFYSPDGLHPSALGSYAVAVSIVGMLYDRSVVGLPASFRIGNSGNYAFDPAAAKIIQEAADEANRQFGAKGTR